MIRITQLKLRPNENSGGIERAIRSALHLKKEEAFSYEILRRSIDARKKPDLYEVYTVSVKPDSANTERKILGRRLKNVSEYEPAAYLYDKDEPGIRNPEKIYAAGISEYADDPSRPLIVGTGPAGLFCGLLLAREGLRPVLIERGARAKERAEAVRAFWDNGVLDPESNVQFGEGGAGTFSDGKLNTGVKDPEGRIRFILKTFVSAGADPDIMYSAKPHVGTDVLRNVVTSITDEIVMRGGSVFFGTRMDRIEQDSGGAWHVHCAGREKNISFLTYHLVLAVGHSSRDTFSMLREAGLPMSAKAFAVGIRIQHPQSVIDRALYGSDPGYRLPPAPYKLTHRLDGGRGVYSFCMCPGGYVVNASSEPGRLAVNGMSFHDRSSGIANSAIVVTVSPGEIRGYLDMLPDDTPAPDPLIGVKFQRRLEQAAFEAGGGMIPVQRFEDFAGADGSISRLPGFEPMICGRWKMADIRSVFPDTIRDGIREGIMAWERQIEGFAGQETVLCAAESRTSSPVRIARGKDYQAPGYAGLYPCGEGAGYAGGITSAAADGLKVAEQILNDVGSKRHF